VDLEDDPVIQERLDPIDCLIEQREIFHGLLILLISKQVEMTMDVLADADSTFFAIEPNRRGANLRMRCGYRDHRIRFLIKPKVDIGGCIGDLPR
jgi:hypothetical protein